MKILDKIRKLLGVRSPTLEGFGHYSCENCEHCTTIYGPQDDIMCCLRKGTIVERYDTCKKSKPLKGPKY